MGMMDKMMNSMVGKMSPEKKQEMMLKMMPMMMEDVNMAETMPKMMPEMMKSITMMDLFNMLKKLMPNLLKGVNSLSEAIPKIMEAMPKIHDKIMPKMMEMMGKDKLEGGMLMPNMMMKMMPHCLDTMLPYMPKEKRIDFALNMATVLVGKQGCDGMSKEEKEDFVAKVVEKVKT